MKLGQDWHQYKFLQPKTYSGSGEGLVVLFATLIWFIAILVRHHLPEAGDWTLGESLVEAFSFVVFAAVPVLGLATQWGDRLATYLLLPNQGLRFQLTLCTALAIFISVGKALNLSPRHFDWIEQFNTLVIPGQFWLNVALFLGGVFIAVRIPFVVQALRQKPQPNLRQQLYRLLLLNTLYLSFHHTANPWEGFSISMVYGAICIGLTWPRPSNAKPPTVGTLNSSPPFLRGAGGDQIRNATPQNAYHLTSPKRLISSDFGLMVLCIAILYWFSIPSFSFGVFMGVDLFILVMIYGSGLGREHFGYSFATRPKDWLVLRGLILAVLLLLVPIAVLSGFVQPSLVQSQFSPLKLGVYFVLFTFRVGIFEEVFFRSGVMVLLRDCLGKGRSPQVTLWLPILGCSILFGLSHIGNAPSANTLSLWQYRGLYIVLATSASMLYAIAFAKTNRLAIPILVHGFVDTTAVVLLGGSLAVPF